VPKFSLSGRRLAVLVAAGVILVVVLVLVVSGLRGGGSSALDNGLQSTGNRVAGVLDSPKHTLPIPDASFQSFQAWYYDLKSALPAARRQLGAKQRLELQVYDKDTFPPQFLGLSSVGGAFVILDAGTLGGVLANGKPAFTDVTVNGRSYRAYVARLTIPPNLRPATVGGYYAILQPSA
jgi:hypothetical protein